MKERKIPEGVYDILIIGGGPAGLTAGLYASRGGMNTLLVESLSVMGQATMTDVIENYPGIDSINGFDMIMSFKKQAEKFGLKTLQGTIKKVSREEKEGVLVWSAEDESGAYKALSVIIATGASPKKLGIPGETEFIGKGVSYCATCDGAFFKEKDIVVVGGGDTAIEEAIYLTKFGKKVTIVHRRDRLRASKVIQERAFNNEKIDFVLSSVVDGISGTSKVEKINLSNKETGEKNEIKADGVFIFVGWLPNTDFAKGVVELDEHDAIIADSAMKTTARGIFAAGDCCKKVLHQVVTAAGDGAVAAYSAQKYVEELKGEAYPERTG